MKEDTLNKPKSFSNFQANMKEKQQIPTVDYYQIEENYIRNILTTLGYSFQNRDE